MNSLSDIEVKNGSIQGIVGDVTQENDVLKIFEIIDSNGKPLESVIYNAGNNDFRPFLEMDLKFFQNLWEVCAMGAFLISQQAIPRLLKMEALYFSLEQLHPLGRDLLSPLLHQPRVQKDRWLRAFQKSLDLKGFMLLM